MSKRGLYEKHAVRTGPLPDHWEPRRCQVCGNTIQRRVYYNKASGRYRGESRGTYAKRKLCANRACLGAFMSRKLRNNRNAAVLGTRPAQPPKRADLPIARRAKRGRRPKRADLPIARQTKRGRRPGQQERNPPLSLDDLGAYIDRHRGYRFTASFLARAFRQDLQHVRFLLQTLVERKAVRVHLSHLPDPEYSTTRRF